MKTLLNDLKKTYKPFKSVFYEYSHQQYQKKVFDDKWIKYFINCALYSVNWENQFEFDAQFDKWDRAININTVSRTSDTKEKWRKYPTLNEIEEMFETMRKASWWEYYELF